jgi:hypothetical protein
MKIRNGFVSNSSSSSFIINLDDITPAQISKIKHHAQHGKHMHMLFVNHPWYITEDDTTIRGETSMDSFDMKEFLDKIGVPSEVVIAALARSPLRSGG